MNTGQPGATGPKQRPVVGDRRWRLVAEDGFLVAVAGADEIWVVDDVPGAVADELAGCWSDQPPTPDQLSAPAQLAVEQLRAVGVFGTPNTMPARPRIAVRWAQHPAPDFLPVLSLLCREHGWPEPVEVADSAAEADLELIVRTSATLADAAAIAGPVLDAGRLHLFCDLAAAHTVALGPFVVPGHSACIGCLAGRVANRWGDPAPPDRPRATEPTGAGTAAALLLEQIDQATADNFPLIDATVAIDLVDLTSRHSPCLRQVSCRSCGGMINDGRVALPWAP